MAFIVNDKSLILLADAMIKYKLWLILASYFLYVSNFFLASAMAE